MEDVRRKHTYHILSRYKLIMFEFDFSILQAHQVCIAAVTTGMHSLPCQHLPSNRMHSPDFQLLLLVYINYWSI